MVGKLPHAENGLLRLSSRAWVGVKEDPRSIFCDHGTVLSPGNKRFHSFHPLRRAVVNVAKRCLENTRQGSRGPPEKLEPQDTRTGRQRRAWKRTDGPAGGGASPASGEARRREGRRGAASTTPGKLRFEPWGRRRESPEELQVMRFKKERMLEITFPKSMANGVRRAAREALRSPRRLLRSLWL